MLSKYLISMCEIHWVSFPFRLTYGYYGQWAYQVTMGIFFLVFRPEERYVLVNKFNIYYVILTCYVNITIFKTLKAQIKTCEPSVYLVPTELNNIVLCDCPLVRYFFLWCFSIHHGETYQWVRTSTLPCSPESESFELLRYFHCPRWELQIFEINTACILKVTKQFWKLGQKWGFSWAICYYYY